MLLMIKYFDASQLKCYLFYDFQKPEEGSEEWKLLDACINPKEWI